VSEQSPGTKEGPPNPGEM